MGVNRRIFYSELSAGALKHVEERRSEIAPQTRNKYERAGVRYSNKNNHLELAGTISKVFMCKIRAEVFTTNNYTHIKTRPPRPPPPPPETISFCFLH